MIWQQLSISYDPKCLSLIDWLFFLFFLRASIHTGSVHQPHFAPAWMHSPQYLAFALMHSFPSVWKTKRKEEDAVSQSAAYSPCQVSSPVSRLSLHVSSSGTLWLYRHRRQELEYPATIILSMMLRWTFGARQWHRRVIVATSFSREDVVITTTNAFGLPAYVTDTDMRQY